MSQSEGELAVAELNFIQPALIEGRPPPVQLTGATAWLRQNLMNTPFNIVLTIVIVLLLAWIIPELIRFLLIDAVWTGADRDACREIVQHRPIGACWPFVYDRFAYLIYGSYPIPERWRVDIFFAMLAVGVVWLLWLEAPKHEYAPIYFFVVLPICSFILLHGFGLIGLAVVDTSLWGGVLVTIVVATVGIVFSLPLGVLLALGRRSDMPTIKLFSVVFIEFVRGVPLITVLFMASVMLPLFVPEQYSPDKLLRALIGIALFSSAYMAEVVRGGLQAIPKGQFEGAMARRPRLLADDAAHHPAAGAEDHHSRHRQHLYRPVQGHDAGVHRRPVRFPAHHRSLPHRSEMGDAGDLGDRLCGRGDLLSVLLLLDVALRARDGSPPCQGRQALAIKQEVPS